MAIDIMMLIIQALRISPQYAQRFPDAINQFLFLIFFPSILVLAIVYLFTHNWFDNKLAFLFAIAFYVFLIVYPPGAQTSLYSILVPIGELWFFVFIIIAVGWFLLRSFGGFGGGGGKAGGPLPGLRHGGGLVGGLIKRKEKIHELDEQISLMQGTLNKMVTASPDKLADYIREFRAAHSIANSLVDELKIAGMDIHGREQKIDRLLHEFSRK